MMNGAAREYDATDIVRRTSALYMTGLFQAVWPRVEFDDTGSSATLVVDVTPVASASVAGGAHWDNDAGGAVWVSLRKHVSLNTPVEFRLSGTASELGHDAGLETSFFSALIPGLRWTGGAWYADSRIRVFDADTVADLLTAERVRLRAGAEVYGPLPDWYLSLGVAADRARLPGAPRTWATGPILRIARAPEPDRVVGVDPLLEAEMRFGDADYQRARLRAGHDGAIGHARAAVLVEVATSSENAPLDVLPSSYRDLAPWLPIGAHRSRHQASIGVDGAVPTLLSGYLRVRLRAFAAAGDVDALGDAEAWRLGGEVGAVWPTVLGPIAIGAAAGQHAPWRFNIAIGSSF
jgi:hypothetical protein